MVTTPETTATHRNRFTLAELAGAFGDLGTLIPFVAAYVSVVKMDPGVILFLAGAQLALGARDLSSDKADRFILLTTAAFAVWNVGIAVVFGILVHYAVRRGWLRL